MRCGSALSALASALLLLVRPGEAELLGRQTGPSSTGTTSSVFTKPTSQPLSKNSSNYDLSQHFCRLWRHASVYADGKIYIDGGNTYVPLDNTTFSNTAAGHTTQGMHENLLVLDLSKGFSNQDTFPYTSLHKPSNVPSSLIEHALWYSAATRKIYQIGGWFSFNSDKDPGFVALSDIPQAVIWEFDIDKQTWAVSNDLNYVNTGTKVDRPGAAANVNVPSLNMSFIFEGYVQQRSDADYRSFAQSSDFKYLEGMLALDTSTAVSKPTLSNISVPAQMGGQDFGPRMNGAMVHVPVGSKGVLIQLGGQIPDKSQKYGVKVANANSKQVNIENAFVDIYDIESGYWFRQTTFGTAEDGIPSGRSDICAVVVPAKDNSSYSIYMIAGTQNYNTSITSEEIWVLTVPTFQWALVHERADGMYGHTCHVVGENLLLVGGMQTKDNKDTTACAAHMPAEIFNLNTQNYTGVFDLDGAKRLAQVPAKITTLIGGTGDGGAPVTAPKAWSDLYLQYVFDPTLTRPSYTPTYVLADGSKPNSTTGSNSTGTGNSTTTTPPPDSGSGGDNKGAIAGGVVGGVVGAALIAGLVWFCLRRRRRQRDEANRMSAMTQHSELPAYTQDPKAELYYANPPPPISPQAAPVELSGAYPPYHYAAVDGHPQYHEGVQQYHDGNPQYQGSDFGAISSDTGAGQHEIYHSPSPASVPTRTTAEDGAGQHVQYAGSEPDSQGNHRYSTPTTVHRGVSPFSEAGGQDPRLYSHLAMSPEQQEHQG